MSRAKHPLGETRAIEWASPAVRAHETVDGNANGGRSERWDQHDLFARHNHLRLTCCPTSSRLPRFRAVRRH
jgi:hypothetical protein